MHFDRQQLETFATVVEEGGFERAAAILHISQSAVSQRIRALEAATGTGLLLRTSPCRPTSSGQVLLRHVRQLRLMEVQITRDMQPGDEALSGLTVAVNADSLATWFVAVIAAALERNQQLLEVLVDDQSRTHDRLRHGEVTGCVTALSAPLPGCESRFLGNMRYVCVCTPDFAARWFPQGLHVRSWRTAPAIAYDRKDHMHAEFIRTCFGIEHAEFPCLRIPSAEAFLTAIRQGAGYGFVPALQLGDMVHTGELIDLMPAYHPVLPLYWQHWSLEPVPAGRLTGLVTDIAVRSLDQ